MVELCSRIKSLRVLCEGALAFTHSYFDISYFVQSIVMIITMSVIAISRKNPHLYADVTPETLQHVRHVGPLNSMKTFILILNQILSLISVQCESVIINESLYTAQ